MNLLNVELKKEKKKEKKREAISIPLNNGKFTMITYWLYLNRTCSIGSYLCILDHHHYILIQRMHLTVLSVQCSSI